MIIVPRNNNDGDAIVIMSIKEYNSLKETEYLLLIKTNKNKLEESTEQLKAKNKVKFNLED